MLALRVRAGKSIQPRSVIRAGWPIRAATIAQSLLFGALMVPEVRTNLVLGFALFTAATSGATTTGAKAPGLGARTLGAQLQYVGCQVGIGIRGPGHLLLTRHLRELCLCDTTLMDVCATGHT